MSVKTHTTVTLSKLILHNVHDVHEFSKKKIDLFLCTHEGEQNINKPSTIQQYVYVC